MTAPLHVDRLSLHAGPLSEAEARRLAQLVGLALGRLPARAAGNVAVRVPTAPGQPAEELAAAIVRAIEEALRTEGAQS